MGVRTLFRHPVVTTNPPGLTLGLGLGMGIAKINVGGMSCRSIGVHPLIMCVPYSHQEHNIIHVTLRVVLATLGYNTFATQYNVWLTCQIQMINLMYSTDPGCYGVAE